MIIFNVDDVTDFILFTMDINLKRHKTTLLGAIEVLTTDNKSMQYLMKKINKTGHRLEYDKIEILINEVIHKNNKYSVLVILEREEINNDGR